MQICDKVCRNIDDLLLLSRKANAYNATRATSTFPCLVFDNNYLNIEYERMTKLGDFLGLETAKLIFNVVNFYHNNGLDNEKYFILNC